MFRIALAAVMTTAALSAPAFAQDSLANASQASGESLEAAAALSEAGVKVTLGSVAVPLASAAAVTSAAGSTAEAIAGELWDTANSPLHIDDDIILAAPAPDGPPNVPSQIQASDAPTHADAHDTGDQE